MPANADPGAQPPVDLIGLTRELVDIDSTTGLEAEVGHRLSAYLRARGMAVVEQPVDADRFNVIASYAKPPEIVLSTHLDCVPPFFPSRLAEGRIYGRGSCDAKGILAAQVAAVDRMRRSGETRVGLLFVVGEERGSDGALKANTVAAGCRFLVNGEPTDNRLGVATRGVLRLRLKACGRAAHSSYPELGESAIDTLVDTLIHLRSLDLPTDPVLGRTHYTIGLIAGGVAPNVVSPAAQAEVMFRTVGEAAALRDAIRSIERNVVVEEILDAPPVTMLRVPGFEEAVFPYTTDIPFLDRWGQPLLFGPGSVHVAHSAHEFVEIGALEAAVDGYARIVRELLN